MDKKFSEWARIINQARNDKLVDDIVDEYIRDFVVPDDTDDTIAEGKKRQGRGSNPRRANALTVYPDRRS